MLSWHQLNLCAQVAPSSECLRSKGPPDRMFANLYPVWFWQPIPSALNLVVAAVLRDSLYIVSLLPCMADCCMLYTVWKVEQFVLNIIKRRLLLSSSPRHSLSRHCTARHNRISNECNMVPNISHRVQTHSTYNRSFWRQVPSGNYCTGADNWK